MCLLSAHRPANFVISHRLMAPPPAKLVFDCDASTSFCIAFRPHPSSGRFVGLLRLRLCTYGGQRRAQPRRAVAVEGASVAVPIGRQRSRPALLTIIFVPNGGQRCAANSACLLDSDKVLLVSY